MFPPDAALAQLVEHIIRNDGVVGSSPIGGTISPENPIARRTPRGYKPFINHRMGNYMKHLLTLSAVLMLLAACGTANKGGCSECEQMARDAKAQHEAVKHADCECGMATAGDCPCCN